jgi:hypothetical protein
MARRRYVLPTLGALFAGAAVAQAASLPGASSDRPAPKVQAAAASDHGPRDFSVRSTFSFDPVTGVRSTDVAPEGPSLGDSLVGSFAFEGPGDLDGRAHAVQWLTQVDAAADPVEAIGAVAQVTYAFGDGSQIATEGFVYQPGIAVGARRTFPITGGSGRFEGVEGTLIVRWEYISPPGTPDEQHVEISVDTFHFTRR